MKRLLPVFFCLLFSCSAAVAQLNGSDDFDDNSMNTGKWFAFSNLFAEVNGRLEYSTSGVGEEEDVWVWILNNGSYTNSWTIEIDASNSLNPVSMHNQYGCIMLIAVNDSDSDNDIFAVGFEAGEYDGSYLIAFCGGETDGVSIPEPYRSVNTNLITLRLMFDAGGETLSGAYNAGDGFVTITNFNTKDWLMDENETFSVAIVGGSEDLVISSGQVYADNFQAITDPGISNHVSFVSIDLIHDYNTPFGSGDDDYSFNFEATTDETITNVTITTPADETIAFADHYIEEGEHVWQYETNSLTPLTNRFQDGNYTVIVTYSNGASESTIIPFAQADGVTPLANVTTQPLFTAPDPLHNTLFSPTNPLSSSSYITFEWGDIDAYANMINIYLDRYDGEELGLFSDIVPFADGPLSTKSVGPTAFTQGVWEVEFFFANLTYQTNSDGVVYAVLKGAESDYTFTVLEASEDEDGDGIPNWWESLYFSGPTNAIASGNPDEDSCDNREEYISGMNPTNATSCFMITNCVPQAGPPAGFLIEWPSVSGRVYRAYWAPTLTNSFHPLETNMFYPRNSCTDTLHGTDGKCFYRIDVQLQ